MAKVKKAQKVYKIADIVNDEIKSRRKVYKTKAGVLKDYEYYSRQRQICILEFELINGKPMIVTAEDELVPRTKMGNFIYG